MSSFSSTDGQSKSNYAGMSERRSIDYIPESERHGHPFSQFTLWFGGNLQITAIVTGALAVVLGGDVVWSLVGLLVGQMLGAAVMSLHALQGPRLGLPQMILSRAQFGVFGAVVPLVLVCVMYIGFSASGTVLAGQAMAKLLNISHVAGMLIFSAIIIVIAVLGYKVIHKLGKLASIVGILAFVYMFITLLLSADLSALAHNNHFSLPTFLLAVSLSLIVADRFLPLCIRLFALPATRCFRHENVVLSVFRHRIGYPNVDDARGSDSGHCRQRVPRSRGELSGGIR